MSMIRKLISSWMLALAGSFLIPLVSMAAISGATYETPSTTTTAPTTVAQSTAGVETGSGGEICMRSMACGEVPSLLGLSGRFLAPRSTPRPHRELVDDFNTNPQNWERTGAQAGTTPSGQHKGGLNMESQWRNKVTGEELSVHEAWRPDGTSIHPENASPNIPDGASIRPRNRAKELR